MFRLNHNIEPSTFVQAALEAAGSVWGVSAPPLALRLRGVVKRYGAITAVDGLDLEVPEGTCVGLLGPNGAGKSTTMRMLTAQAIADEGEIEVLGCRLPERVQGGARECGVVPQLDNLDTTLTVEQNLRRLRAPVPGRPRATARRRSSARWRSRTSPTAATRGSTSCRAACAGGC